MSRYMVRICSDGQIERIPCKGILKLDTLQKLVGGYIETVPVRMKPEEGVWPLLIVDEEGRLKGKPLNTAATLLADVDHSIVGDAVLVGAIGAELIGVSRETADKVAECLGALYVCKKEEKHEPDRDL